MAARRRAVRNSEFDLAQREMGLKEPPKPEQLYDFSILEELTKK